MTKCLMTKLDGLVNNSSLLKLGEFRIKISKVSSPTSKTQGFLVNFLEDTQLTIIGDGYFTDKTLTNNEGTVKTIPKNKNVVIEVSNGDFEILVSNKYNLNVFNDFGEYNGEINYPFNNKVLSDIGIFKYSPLRDLTLYNTNISGDIGQLSTLTQLQSLIISDTNISGDIGQLSTLTQLQSLFLSFVNISGDIGQLSTLTQLQSLSLSFVNISGDIGQLSTLTQLQSLQINSKQMILETTVLKLQPFKKLRIFYFKESKLTGDLAKVPESLVFISLLRDKGSVLTWSSRSTSLPILSIEGTAFCENIDNMLINQAQCEPSNISSKIISVSGTRTSSSDEAISILQQKGYTIKIEQI